MGESLSAAGTALPWTWYFEIELPAGRDGKRQQSPTTLHRIRGELHAALNAAIRRGLITQNPAH